MHVVYQNDQEIPLYVLNESQSLTNQIKAADGEKKPFWPKSCLDIGHDHLDSGQADVGPILIYANIALIFWLESHGFVWQNICK